MIKNVIKKTYKYLRGRKNYLILKLNIKKRPLKIIIGASGENFFSTVSQKGWLATDIDFLDLLKPLDWNRLFKQDSVDAILVEHVWEHMSVREGIEAAKMCFKYLRRNGHVRVAVPDGYHPDPGYIERVKVNGMGPGAKDHKVLYNYKTLKEVFESAGFRVSLLEYYNERGNFISRAWNPSGGLIHRSKNYDRRNVNGELNYTSIIIDAIK